MSSNFEWNGLPTDVLNLICSNLNGQECNNFRRVSKGIQNAVDSTEAVKTSKRIQFNDLFGAGSPEELETVSSINSLATRVHTTLKLTNPSMVWPCLIFEEGYPKVLPNSLYTEKNFAKWGQQAKNAIINTIDGTYKTVQFFRTTPLNELNPLQDLRDRVTRIRNMDSELKILLETLKTQFDSVYEDCHRYMWDKISSKMYLPQPDNVLPLDKRQVQFNSIEVVLDGKKIPLNILAYPGRDEGSLFIEIRKNDSDKAVCTMRVFKAWRQERSSYAYDEDHTSPPKGKLMDPYIDIRIVTDYLRQDQENGDLPGLRILTQIAVEIAERESVTEINIDSVYNHAHVYAMAGFYDKDFDYHDHISPIHKRILNERMQNKKIFPEVEDCSGIKACLDKRQFSGEHGTKFFRKNDQGEVVPAYVEFDLDGKKSTWEEMIAKQPILPWRQGPVFWRFWKRDLSKLQ